MGSININIGGRALEGEIQRIADRLPSALTQFLDDLSSDVEVLMKDESPVRLGDLQNSITTDSISMTERLIWPTVEHAAFVILGTRPHWIEAHHDSYLGVSIRQGFLYWPGADHPVRRVHHPGTSPNPFPDRAADRADRFIEIHKEEFYNTLLE